MDPSSPFRGLPAPFGAPLALGYGAALILRHAFPRRVRRAALPVICVGNLTVGGTGKTPAVAWVVEVLRRAGLQPAILSRGYGQDEVALLTRSCPGVPLVAEGDRVKGAAAALSQGAQALVLDDGFQHQRLWRDLDLVLLDATEPWGGGHLLPWGLLREPEAALARAGAVLITRSDQVERGTIEVLRNQVSRLSPGALIAEGVHQPTVLARLGGGREDPPASLARKRVVAACGIGNPQAFERSLRSLGATLAGIRIFPDHHAYGPADVDALNMAARASVSESVVVTEKDAVKLEAFPGARDWQVLKVRMAVAKGGEALEALIRKTAGAGS